MYYKPLRVAVREPVVSVAAAFVLPLKGIHPLRLIL